LPDWKAFVGAKFLEIPGHAGRRLDEIRAVRNNREPDGGVSGVDLAQLLRRQAAGEISAEQLVRELAAARQRPPDGGDNDGAVGVSEELSRVSGLPLQVWEDAAQELLESILPGEIAQPRSLHREPPAQQADTLLDGMGISDVELLSDFPIVLASYGFSRTEPAPRRPGQNEVLCNLNPFPQDREHGGRWPIFVDETTADALMIRVNSRRVVDWLLANGANVALPNAENPDAASRAYFVNLLGGRQLRETLPGTDREARMVFGLLHTLSHTLVKEAALLCGLDRISIAEYMLPRALAFAIYCSHRSGQSIGALTALFEQSINEWFGAARSRRRCVYDPVCRVDGGSCHACTHLSETSCRFFNMNLSRAYLFGGPDAELGPIHVGFLDMLP
jgi:hypothetical protein